MKLKFILKHHELSSNYFIHELGNFSTSWVISQSSKLVVTRACKAQTILEILINVKY
jgi:hypothetical protein